MQSSRIKKRFTVSKQTLRIDRLMTQFIKLGGIGIIAAVVAIFIFLLSQIFPLFQRARVTEKAIYLTSLNETVLLGADASLKHPFLVEKNGTVHFLSLDKANLSFAGREANGTPRFTLQNIPHSTLPLPEGVTVTALRYWPEKNQLLCGTSEGQCLLIQVQTASLTLTALPKMAGDGAILSIDALEANGKDWLAILQETQTGPRVYTCCLSDPLHPIDVTPQIPGIPQKVLLTGLGDALLVTTQDRFVHFIRSKDHQFECLHSFEPFADQKGATLDSLDRLNGNISCVATSCSGENRLLTLVFDQKKEQLIYRTIKEFPSLGAGKHFFGKSLRNRAFLTGNEQKAFLCYGTTGKVRWKKKLSYAPDKGLIGEKYDEILMEGGGQLHLYALEDPHPEATLSSFFGKMWYEGHDRPSYMWQSSGEDSDYEPKLSLIPLFFGSLKGTFFALLFALPIAILAALYTSQFLKPELKKVVKPTMEIMASLPSVVLGFLGAMWLAPVLENRIPSVLVALLFLPLSALLIGVLNNNLPQHIRSRFNCGFEFLFFIPIFLLVAGSAWELGPIVEKWLFTPSFPEWWERTTSLPFEQRNTLIIAFMMGFAAIPIIFTIAEDALSNVPRFLTSASLALGASRWQTAWRIILPTASPGIFAAFMIGLGRTVGETMIVVMATGNTPILSGNLFDGMRTLSANIAVELPEAPVHSTLYRTLFLGAILLFILTFLVNTIAELTRQKLRNKYKTTT